MKIIDLEFRREYDIAMAKSSGEESQPCPRCSHLRKPGNQKAKVFSWNHDKQTGYCNHCQSTFVIPRKPLKPDYARPVWLNNTELSDAVVRWFEKRGISQFTLRHARITEGQEFMPQDAKVINTVQFNYFRDDELVNVKYRTGNKHFKMYKDAELVFYNLDGIRESDTAVITEGEIDALSFWEAGIHNVVSVPNGASLGTNNLQYLDNCAEWFDGKTSVVIATDNDQPGVALRNELASRLGVERCWKVNFKDCKDANEYLVKYGADDLRTLLDEKEPFPVEGIFTARDVFDELDLLYRDGLHKGETIGDPQMDELISFDRGRLYVITGIPGHGKSEFLDHWLVRLNIAHGLKFGYFSPENYPLQLHHSKIISRITGSEFSQRSMPYSEFIEAVNYVSENFFWVMPHEEYNIDAILERARYLVYRRGIAGFVIDPYNKLEHSMGGGESETNYISRFLDRLTTFAQKNNIAIFLVAHPRKMPKDRDSAVKKMEVPNLYDINGSANFFNKTDFGVTVYRDFTDGRVEIHVQKVKFKHLGRVGRVDYCYNSRSGRFEMFGTADQGWDRTNWMHSRPQPKTQQEIEFYGKTDEEPPF